MTEGPTKLTLSSPQQCVRVIQFISAVLIMGAIVFTGVALVVTEAQFDGSPAILTWMAAGFAGLEFLLHLILPGIIANQSLSQIDTHNLSQLSDDQKFLRIFPVYQVRQIVAMALLEGAAFFCIVAYLIENSPIALAVAAALMMVMAVRFPTAAGVQFWVENKIREVEMTGSIG